MSTYNPRRVCPSCGAELALPNALFCTECGAKVTEKVSVIDFSFNDNDSSEETICATDGMTMTAEEGYHPSVGGTPIGGAPIGGAPIGQPPVPAAAGGSSSVPTSAYSDPSEEPTWIPEPKGGDTPEEPPTVQREVTPKMPEESSVPQPEELPNQPKSVFEDSIGQESGGSDRPPFFGVQQPYSTSAQQSGSVQQPNPAQPFYPNSAQQPYPGSGMNQYPNQMPYPGYAPSAYVQGKNAKAGGRPKKKWVLPVVLSVVAGVLLLSAVGFGVWKTMLGPSREYDKACGLMEEGRYDDAIELFEGLGDYKDSGDKITESKYQKACAALENGDYQTAEEFFKKLGDYRDSSDKALESKYRYGISLIEGGYYTKAVEVFEELEDYSDSRDYQNEAKYLYCQENCNCTDETTFAYLSYLKSIGYKDCEDMYLSIYAIHLDVAFINADPNDETTVNYSVSKYNTYFHMGFDVTGGTPGETFTLYRVIIYPDGTKYNSSDDPWANIGNGSRCSIYWSDGLYTNPQYGSAGSFYIDIYNQSTKKRIKRFTIRITD